MNENYKSVTDTVRKRERERQKQSKNNGAFGWQGVKQGEREGNRERFGKTRSLRKLVGPKRSLEVQKHYSQERERERERGAGNEG